MTRTCFFFFKKVLKLTSSRCTTLDGSSFHGFSGGGGGGGSDGFWKVRSIDGLNEPQNDFKFQTHFHKFHNFIGIPYGDIKFEFAIYEILYGRVSFYIET